MHTPAFRLTRCHLALVAVSTFFASTVWAQAPNWAPVIEGESLFVDTASFTLSPNAPAGERWVEFDMVLNTPVPDSQEDAAELNAFFGAEPKSFFNHATINCSDIAVREESNGIAYGHFQTPRRAPSGRPYQPFELDQLIEYDRHSNPSFEAISSEAEAQRYAQLMCQPTAPLTADTQLSLAQLNQAVPSVSHAAQLIPLVNYPDKFLDQASIKQHVDAPHIHDFNIVYHMPKDDPQFAQATEPYGLDQFTLVFDRSINCQARSMRSNHRAITATYEPTSLLLEYRPQANADYLPLTAEEDSLYALVCPAPIVPVAAPAAPSVKPAAPIRRPSPFRTEYD